MAGSRTGGGKGKNWTRSPASGTPARDYSWPPFEAGNELALAHGARSPRRLAPLAERFEAEIVEAAPWVSRPAFAGALRSLAYCEAEISLRRAWVDEHGFADMDGHEPERKAQRHSDARLSAAESRAHKLRSELGLTPQSYAALVARIASIGRRAGGPIDDDALAALEAEGRAILQAREKTLPAPDGPEVQG